jgi:hypothetical protein
MNDNEAQLYGPMPMYLMQGAQQYRGGYPSQPGGQHMQMPGSNVQFDDLLNQEDWSQQFMDPALNMNNPRPPLGNAQFSQHGWR